MGVGRAALAEGCGHAWPARRSRTNTHTHTLPSSRNAAVWRGGGGLVVCGRRIAAAEGGMEACGGFVCLGGCFLFPSVYNRPATGGS